MIKHRTSHKLSTRLVYCCVLFFVAIGGVDYIHIHQGYSAGIGADTSLPQIQWNNPHEYGKIHPTKSLRDDTTTNN